MDGNRFDEVMRSLRGTSPRRGAVALLMGGALGLAGLAESEAKGKKKGKKKGKGKGKPKRSDFCEGVANSCGLKCDVGANCCSSFDCSACRGLVCSGDQATPGKCVCDEGQEYMNGRCGTQPQCYPAGALRKDQFDTRCCSGIETPVEGDFLAKCEPGTLSCFSDNDCTGGVCRGYECYAFELNCGLD